VGIRIASAALATPGRTQSAEELAPRIHRPAEWIHEHTGVHQRFVSDADLSPSVLAAQAARQVIQQSGTPDLILYAGALTQQLVPDTSAFVLRELNLEGVPAFTVNQTCLSFVAALQVADGLLKAGSYQRILICSAELATRGRSFHEPESAALLGDGAAAAMVEFSADPAIGMLHSKLATWSEAIDMCYVKAGIHPPPDPDMDFENLFCFHMNGPNLYRFVRPRLIRFLADFFRHAQCSPQDIDLVVPHQASGPGLRLLEKLGFPDDKVINIIGEYGNCVAASIPMALAIAMQHNRIKQGDRVLFLGTAAGVSIGAALVRW
jgi:3-oxoacyl-[acyl-carrier-protein] synthase III